MTMQLVKLLIKYPKQNLYQRKFKSLEQLQLELAEYVYWYNNLRIHGSLGYILSIEYRESKTRNLAKAS